MVIGQKTSDFEGYAGTRGEATAHPAAATAPPERERMSMIYWLVCFMFRMLGRIWNRQRIIGLDNVPKTGPVLVLPTHTSYYDPPLVGSNILRSAHYLAREGILKAPIIGPLCQYHLHAHPIRRGASDREAIRTCRNILKEGYPLLFFPEGTRSLDGKLGRIQGGFAMILEGLDVPYVPVMAQSSYQILRKGWAFPRPHRLTIIYGKPTRLPLRNDGETTREFFKRCCDKLEQELRELGAE